MRCPIRTPEGSGMKKLKQVLSAIKIDLILVAGATAVAVGAGMIYLPAGLIAGGVLTIAGGVLLVIGGDAE